MIVEGQEPFGAFLRIGELATLKFLYIIAIIHLVACGSEVVIDNRSPSSQVTEVGVDLVCDKQLNLNRDLTLCRESNAADINLNQLKADLVKAENKAAYIKRACRKNSIECPKNQYFQLLYTEESLQGSVWKGNLKDNLKCFNDGEVECFQDGDRQVTNFPQTNSLIAGNPEDNYSNIEDESVDELGISVKYVTIDGNKYLINRCSAKPSETVFYGHPLFNENPYVSSDRNSLEFEDVSHIPVTCEFQNNLAATLTAKYKQVSASAKRSIRATEIEGLILTVAIGAVAFAVLGPGSSLLLGQLGMEASSIATMGAIAQASFAAGGGAYMTYSAVKSGMELKECTNDECRIHARFSLVSDAVFAVLSFADYAGQVNSAYGPKKKASGMGYLLKQWDSVRPKIKSESTYTPLLEKQSKALAAGIMDQNIANVIKGSGRWENISNKTRKVVLNKFVNKPWKNLQQKEFWKQLEFETLGSPLTEQEALDFANKIEYASADIKTADKMLLPEHNGGMCLTGEFGFTLTGPSCIYGALNNKLNTLYSHFSKQGGGVYDGLVSLEEWEFGSFIGKGSYGSIRRVQIGEKVYALKQVKVSTENKFQISIEFGNAIAFGEEGIGPRVHYAKRQGAEAFYLMDLAKSDAQHAKMTKAQIISYGEKQTNLLDLGFIALDDKPGNILLKGNDAFMHDIDFVYFIKQGNQIPSFDEFGTFAPFEALDATYAKLHPYNPEYLQSFYFGLNVLNSKFGWTEFASYILSPKASSIVEGRTVVNGDRLSEVLAGKHSRINMSKESFDMLRAMIVNDYRFRPKVSDFIEHFQGE